MTARLQGAILAGMLGLLSMLPFLALELRTRPGDAELPLLLFVMLWLLGTAFVALLLPILRKGLRLRAILIRLALSAVIASLWVGGAVLQLR